MTASLGATSDPRALVPGNPVVVYGFATALSGRAARAEEAADRLADVRVPSWTGESADAFWAVMEAQPRQWRTTADALTAAASALTGYADVLAAAQADASAAIDLWDRAQAATQEADRAHRAAVRAFQQAVISGRNALTPDPFVDAGAPLRDEALDVLASARAAVADAGAAAARAIEGLQVTAPWLLDGGTSSQWLTAEGSTSGSVFSWDPRTGEGRWGLGSAQGEAWLWKGRAWGEASRGGTTFSGEVEGGLGATGEAKAGIQDGELRLGASGRAGALVEGTGRVVNEGGEAEIGFDALAGVSADTGLAVGKNGVTGKSELFAGGKVGFDGGGQLGPVDVTGRVEAWRGYGYVVDYQIGTDESGAWVVGGKAGYGQGTGTAISVGFKVDPADLVRAAQEVLPFLRETDPR